MLDSPLNSPMNNRMPLSVRSVDSGYHEPLSVRSVDLGKKNYFILLGMNYCFKIIIFLVYFFCQSSIV